MKLMTKELRLSLPSTDEANQKSLYDLKANVKLFTPDGSATWWIAGYDHETGDCFGVADLFGDPMSADIGYFSLPELSKVRGKMGLPIERDLYWKPQTLAEILGITEDAIIAGE